MKKMKNAVVMSVVLLTSFSFMGDVFAQSSRDIRRMEQAIERLEKQLNAVQRRVFNGEVPAVEGDNTSSQQNLLANMDGRLLQIERQMRELTGRLEVIEFQNSTLKDELERFKGDMALQLEDLKKNGVSTNGESSESTTTAPMSMANTGVAPSSNESVESSPNVTRLSEPTVPTLPTGAPMEQYEFAYGLLTKSQYVQAEAAFKAFLEQNGDHELAANAQYWLGETYYARQMWADALGAFLSGYEKYGKGPKGPDSLLKMGLTLASMDEKEQACLAFNELLDVYPDASTNIRRRLDAEKGRLGCS